MRALLFCGSRGRDRGLADGGRCRERSVRAEAGSSARIDSPTGSESPSAKRSSASCWEHPKNVHFEPTFRCEFGRNLIRGDTLSLLFTGEVRECRELQAS